MLKFGTVNWEIDTIIHNKLDEANGFKLEMVVLASNDATRIAIKAGEVDVIVSDWLFVSRQRAEGVPLTFVPYSTSVGAIMVPPDSTVQDARRPEGRDDRRRRRAARQELADASAAWRRTSTASTSQARPSRPSARRRSSWRS